MTLLIDPGRFAPMKCTHHWVLPNPEDEPGPTMTGRCKRCGESRTYQKSPDWDKKTISLFDERKQGPTTVYPIREAWDI